jgi:hypothetical protein
MDPAPSTTPVSTAALAARTVIRCGIAARVVRIMPVLYSPLRWPAPGAAGREFRRTRPDHSGRGPIRARGGGCCTRGGSRGAPRWRHRGRSTPLRPWRTGHDNEDRRAFGWLGVLYPICDFNPQLQTASGAIRSLLVVPHGPGRRCARPTRLWYAPGERPLEVG